MKLKNYKKYLNNKEYFKNSLAKDFENGFKKLGKDIKKLSWFPSSNDFTL